MRKNKFRSWNNVVEQMLEHESLERALKDLTKIKYIKGIMLPSNKENVIMQFTGLSDKNGVEIYEGDIVQCNNRKDDLSEIKFGEFTVRAEEDIMGVITGWYFKLLDNDVFGNVEPFCYPMPLNEYWIDKLDIKVVGNIYENPELMEKK